MAESLTADGADALGENKAVEALIVEHGKVAYLSDIECLQIVADLSGYHHITAVGAHVAAGVGIGGEVGKSHSLAG